MDRRIVYIGAIPQDVDLLLTNRNAMISDGILAQGILGTSTLFSGLACSPTSPAGMTVNVAPGCVFSQQNIDNSAYGSLNADTTEQIVKIGISLDTVNFSCPAPATTGQSVVYLIEAAFLEEDTGAAVLPYYNAANPATPWSGPNNTGVSQNTTRQNICSVQVKAGVPATTGTQTIPAPDTGYTGLWAITVANGQTTITSGNISLASGAPFLSETLGQKISIPTGDARYLQIVNGRTRLLANTNFYVATTGNDSNPGTSGSPWLTLQHAVNYVLNSLDTGGFTVTINVANGTYTGGIRLNSPFTGGGLVQLQGNSTTPASCIISTTGTDCIYSGSGSVISISGFQLQTTTSGNCLLANAGGQIFVDGPMNYGVCAGNHIEANGPGALVFIVSNYTISGSASAHWAAQTGSASINCTAQTITLTGTPAFSGAFASANLCSSMTIIGNTFTGSATGIRYNSNTSSIISTNGAGATYLPGGTAGTTATGGLYV